MQRILIILALLSVVGFAKTDREIQNDVQQILSDPFRAPTQKWWTQLGPKAPKVLLTMFNKTTDIHHQIRLVEGLGNFSTPEAIAFLKQQGETSPNKVLQAVAVRAIAQGQGLKEEEFLRRRLESSDPQMRAQTAQALKRLRDPQATKLVREVAQKEEVDWVKKRMLE